MNPVVDAATPKACPSCGARYPADALFCSRDGAPLVTSPGAIAAVAATDPYVGREILGHIEIRQLVGLGAMGRVYRAFQKGIDRDVAVKILHRELSANQMLVTRFHREAKVASRLAHPNVVHVLLTGQLPDGALYIVMEYLDGLSLQSALAATGGAMPLPRALHIALQLCDAAGEAHAHGVVHRDLKPENVMLVKRADDPDYVKVLDFGIARLNWGEQSMATAAGLIFGTARYISPEGAQGEQVGPTGDVYAIATMVYQMLSGRTPFEAEQAVAMLVQQIHDAPLELRRVPRAAYVPEPIADAVMSNLAKKASERAPDARALGRALLQSAVTSGLSAQDILARPSMLAQGRGQSSSVVQMPSMQRTDKLHLGPEVAARIGARGSEVIDSRAPARTEVPDPTALPPGSATTKWSPPADFEARLIPTPPPASVDSTMDDQQLALISRGSAISAPPPSSRVPTPPPSRPLTMADTAAPPPRSAPHPIRVPTSSEAGNGPVLLARVPTPVETTMAGEEGLGRLPLTRGRTFAVIAACFLVGALGMGAVAYRAGLLGGHTQGGRLDSFVARATDALAHERWDAPPGENVRDLTDQGLARFPRDPRLLHVRALASTEVVAAAKARRDAGDDASAVRLAALAVQLDPDDPAATALVEELAAPAQTAPTAPAIPPLANGRAGSTPILARVTLDVSNAHPGVGQPVDLSARVLGAARDGKPGGASIEGPVFRVTGPGIAPGTPIEATDAGSGTFHASFTFPQVGRYEVAFSARADGGALVRAVRSVVVGDASPLPQTPQPLPAPDTTAPPATAPAITGKWL